MCAVHQRSTAVFFTTTAESGFSTVRRSAEAWMPGTCSSIAIRMYVHNEGGRLCHIPPFERQPFFISTFFFGSVNVFFPFGLFLNPCEGLVFNLYAVFLVRVCVCVFWAGYRSVASCLCEPPFVEIIFCFHEHRCRLSFFFFHFNVSASSMSALPSGISDKRFSVWCVPFCSLN